MSLYAIPELIERLTAINIGDATLADAQVIYEASEALKRLCASNERLRAALIDLRQGIEKHATDTMWYSPIETACDRITAILSESALTAAETWNDRF